ncbi:MAG TPA: signal recognition particle-docking protein FtsY, partial [Pseudomonas sp.]|nr:signal recognition particle-docking protein FtsY [Pseudomonas sp.]
MFGSNDDKKSPAEAGAQTPPVTEEKKSLFSWWRKKPAETPAEPAQPAPVEPAAPAQAPVEPSPPAPEALPAAESAAETPVVDVTPAPAPPIAEAPVAEPMVVEPTPVAVEPIAEVAPVEAAPAPVAAPATQDKPGFFARLKQGLSKTSASLGEGMASLFLGKKAIDDDLLDDLETRLLTADVGVEATTAIIGNLTQRVARQ